MFAARSASLCSAARVTATKTSMTSPGGGSTTSRGTRGALHVVAMGKRSRVKKARKEQPSGDGGVGGGDGDAGVQTAAAPAQQQQQQQQQQQAQQRAAEQRGPERLSQKDWAEIEAENTRARDAMGAAPAPGPAGTGLIDKAFSSDAMLMFGVDGCVPETVNGRVAMLGFVSAFFTELATGKSFTTQLAYNITHGKDGRRDRIRSNSLTHSLARSLVLFAARRI